VRNARENKYSVWESHKILSATVGGTRNYYFVLKDLLILKKSIPGTNIFLKNEMSKSLNNSTM
jgi:hypothetical protein